MSEPEMAMPYGDHGLQLDSLQGNRAKEIKIFSIKRPYMRAFHASWISFFLAFVVWFSFTPLLDDVQDSLGLSKKGLWVSTVLAMASPVMGRLILGPLVDSFGTSRAQTILLIMAAIPAALGGFVQSLAGLCIVRFAVGMVGASFVCSQTWASNMFAGNVVGAANATVAGWGNFGGAVSILSMFAINEALKSTALGRDAWRVALVIPAGIVFLWGLVLPHIADDNPYGTMTNLVKEGKIKQAIIRQAAEKGFRDKNSWLLFLMYSASFGVELHLYNSAGKYFEERFDVARARAYWVTSLFGLMNLFARPLGGVLSDYADSKRGLSGRLWVHSLVLFGQGLLMVGFSQVDSLSGGIILLVVLSCFVQASEGLCYGIVPFVQPLAIATVSGVVAAGGSLGAMLYAVYFAYLPRPSDQEEGYLYIGLFTTFAAFLGPFLSIRGHTFRGPPKQAEGKLANALDLPANSGSVFLPFCFVSAFEDEIVA